MATKIDAKAEAFLRQLEARGKGTASGTKITPEAEQFLQGIEAQGRRITPPAPPDPVIVQQPAPVMDPVSGQAMQRGRPVDNAAQPADTRGLEGALNTVKDYAFKPLTAFVDPLNAGLNAAVDEGLAAEAQGGPVEGFLGFFRGLVTKAPSAAFKAITAPPTTPHFVSKPLRASGANPIVAEGAQFLTSIIAVDPAAGRMVGGLLGLAGRKGKAAADAAGLLDVKVGGKSIRGLEADAGVRRAVKQYFVRGDALAGQLKREGDQVVRNLEKIYKRQPANIVRKAENGRRVNLMDEFATDWIEAGTPGAKYADRAAVEAAAQQVGVKVPDLRDAGTQISNLYQKSGKWLEEVGLLTPGTVARFGGRYAARLYHVSSHNAGDIEAALRVAEELDSLSPQAVALGQKLLQKQARGGFAPLKPRKITDFAEREARLAERQAGVVLGGALPKQARLGAKGEALKQISQDPALFSPTEITGWVPMKVGPVEGFFHPAAAETVQKLTQIVEEPPILKFAAGIAGAIKKSWAGYNPVVQGRNVAQNLALAEGAAGVRGINYGVADVLQDIKPFWAAVTGKAKDPFFEGLASSAGRGGEQPAKRYRDRHGGAEGGQRREGGSGRPHRSVRHG
jgi:hypothetical protein